MTLLEELQAAHKRLSDMKAASTRGPWELVYMMGRADWPVVISDGIGEVINTRPEDLTIRGSDADLIVTLHRTIDVQLALLADGIEDETERMELFTIAGREEMLIHHPRALQTLLRLARAINGAIS